MSSIRIYAVVALVCLFLVIETSAYDHKYTAQAAFADKQRERRAAESTIASLKKKRDAGQISQEDFDRYTEHLLNKLK